MRMKRIVCSLLVVTLAIASLSLFPVVAEEQSSGTTSTSTTTESTSDSAVIFEKDHIFVGVGQTHTFAVCEGASLSGFFVKTNVTDSTLFRINEDNSITGLSPGEVSVEVWGMKNGSLVADECIVTVMEQAAISNENYYIKWKGRPFCINFEGVIREPENISQNDLLWHFMKDSDGYYSIVIAYYYPAYLCIRKDSISSGAQVQVVNTLNQNLFTDYETKWSILMEPSGGLLLVPKGAENANLALSVPNAIVSSGDGLVLSDYYSGYTQTKRWVLYSERIYIRNYYDGSTISDLDMIAAISFVNDFFTTQVLGNVEQKGGAEYYSGLPADMCTLGQNVMCTTDACGACSEHHKNVDNMYSAALDIPRRNNEITVVWSDRPGNVYCYNGVNGHTPYNSGDSVVVAFTNTQLGAGRQSAIQFLTFIDFITESRGTTAYRNKIQASMSIVLAHEMGHILGLPELYNNDSHSGSGAYSCVMERYKNQYVNSFYDGIVNGVPTLDGDVEYLSPFCDDCLEQLIESRMFFMQAGNLGNYY